ncbi:MAG TPA: V-type ATP synthase subunit E family protein [Candidatus Bathyarchaeia archaeon]|nr:V-type ATP synthase subunit E family protein [Candidatus Bathyarchaeia archaeon]
MTYENLIASMEAGTEKSITGVMQKAHQEAEEIKRSADAKAEAIKASYLDEAQKSAETERNKLIYNVKAENKMRIIKEKDAVIQRAFLGAKKRLENFRDHTNYKENFKTMLEEAVRELEDEQVRLHIDPRDETLCRQVLGEIGRNSEIVTDLTSTGGLSVSTKDGKIVVSNTIESRLNKAKELLKRDVFSTLFGE